MSKIFKNFFPNLANFFNPTYRLFNEQKERLMIAGFSEMESYRIILKINRIFIGCSDANINDAIILYSMSKHHCALDHQTFMHFCHCGIRLVDHIDIDAIKKEPISFQDFDNVLNDIEVKYRARGIPSNSRIVILESITRGHYL